MNTSELEQLITNELPCTHLKIDGDGRHFFMEIVSDAFIGKTRIARHRLIKEKLKHLIVSDELHAISITMAKTPEEWKTC